MHVTYMLDAEISEALRRFHAQKDSPVHREQEAAKQAYYDWVTTSMRAAERAASPAKEWKFSKDKSLFEVMTALELDPDEALAHVDRLLDSARISPHVDFARYAKILKCAQDAKALIQSHDKGAWASDSEEE